MSTTLPTSSATRKKRKRTKLIECVNSGNVDKIVKILVNLDPNFIDEPTGETPLGLAASAANQQTITLQRVIVGLVNGGAMLDFRNKEGKTALHTAVIKSNYVALKTFLDLGASPNFKDSQGLTPLFCTIINKSNAKLTQLLLHEHSIHGLRDQHGWCEVHHACKLGLVGHLEQMLYYGADMNCHIVGSGNTPLHVAAINDQTECARLLLLRGCDASLVNNSHQNAYQVGVIAGNLALAEMIKGHRQENVVPYRDKPKYNPARRPGGLSADFTPRSILVAPKGSQPAGTGRPCCPASPCLSQRSCATSASLSTTSSSGGCCDMSSHSESACESDATGSHGFETGTSCTSEDESAATTITAPAPGARVEGRREQKLLGVGSSTTLPVRGRRTQQLSSQASSGLSSAAGTSSPTGSDSGSNQSSSGSDQTPPPITSYNEKTVSLHRVDKGFGFVLRGAKATSPVMGQQVKSLALQPISLQYLDEIETDGVAQLAGLCRGDFLLNVNGVDVRQAPHEHVVQLIDSLGTR
ncbi:SH3 and multiple ankyrin repeat domains protein 3 [Halotydeus destructor]|nr:SH3 and multiple ankyrin repeat domains protein 3 [Halotydeus destructor]